MVPARRSTRTVAASYYTGSGQGSCGLGLGMTFAELNMGTALGRLACGTRVNVTYKGKTITVTKTDIGLGGAGVQGLPRAIDLYIDAAKALGFDFQAGIIPVQIQILGVGRSGKGSKSNPQPLPSRPGKTGDTGSGLERLRAAYERALARRKGYEI